MTTQAQELAERLRAFNEEVIAFVQSLSEEEWRGTCESEQCAERWRKKSDPILTMEVNLARTRTPGN